jgi:phage replication initiation protein
MAKNNFNTLIPYAQHIINQKMLLAALDAEKHNSRKTYFSNYTPMLARDSAAPRKRCPPSTNRGGKSENLQLASYQALEKLDFVSFGRSGQFKTVATPKPHIKANVTHSFIDWVNFTFKIGNLPVQVKQQGQPDMECVHSLSALLFDVFGYGVTGQRLSGMNFYEKSFDLGHNGWGLVCIGGQNDTCSVTVKGQGLLSAKPGWEQRLFSLLNRIPESKLTRVDLASDNFNSKLTVDDYLDMYKAAMFTMRGRPPSVEQAGNWINPDGKGRTLYIGNRKSGKLLRIYEKGLQLANGFHEKYPNWLRVELEMKNQDRVIPLDVLLRPGQYLAGAYPALADLHKTQDRIQTLKKTVKSTFEKSLAVTRHQFGKHIWTQAQILGVEKTFELLTEGKNEIPKQLNFDTFAQYHETLYMHSDDLNNFLIPVPF